MISFEISGHFSIDASVDCAKIEYLGVEITPGDSEQVEGAEWGVVDNNKRLTPLNLRCVRGGGSLSIAPLQFLFMIISYYFNTINYSGLYILQSWS